MTSPLDPPAGTEPLPLPGLEADNLLAVLALLGLLRALETSRPEWRARASWTGQPWQARLHLAAPAREDEVAAAAAEGVETIAATFDVGGRKNVDFERADFRAFAAAQRDPDAAALAAALAAEFPTKRDGGLMPAPLVMMFGQGHQNFLERLVAVPRGDLPARHAKLRTPPDFGSPAMIADALFRPWRREDDADGFRWDPADDQRYALRFDDPSRAGAAPTVHGANRLAAVGFLSCATAPRQHRLAAVGAHRADGEWTFVWPIWAPALSRAAIEALLAHPSLGDPGADLAPLGVRAVLRARRIANGKFMNVTRAVPLSG